ncbi:uncharacterized protein Z518_05363 [Rhinocladiella mackenziei CBS 650.93]|uniref:C2H2-type domain-containing protein n=1 Tax=Rhinocladiella mackenziei CBS 650.93 TaxID=1442369 RepID=A0A0D2H267_9EURO|nr:uncharacterized protein Z518_05363 [Rhinocladiella mackenziei CBS 650.93]KIX04493.1 hypothetical protein Z518_05363 [Rhinocladiella mackenziei CBS 650.93]
MDSSNGSPKQYTWPTIPTPKRRRQLQCQYCPNTYQKKEHLVRHERTHTGHRPFVCAQCGRTFARHDSLLRHERVHAPKIRDASSQQMKFSALESRQNAPQSTDLNDGLNAMAQDVNVQQPVERNPSANNPDVAAVGFNGAPYFNETEDFFQYLLSTPPGWPTSLPTDVSTDSLPGNRNSGNFRGGSQPLQSLDDGSPQAVQQVGALITDMSSNVTREINARGITSDFLDACLHQFFTHFNPTFPILHEATFDLKDCGPFLLLNMVSIGSLFFGSSDAVAKGEFLWRLAQTAAATSWGDVFEGKIAAFRSQAAQIVTTALLGQTYAMLSRSGRLRTLCQTLHGLAFSWARQFGMFDLPDFALHELPDDSAGDEEKHEKWKDWVAREIQRRTVLGLYIIDSQLARYAGAGPVGKHVTNPLKFASKDTVFQARTVEDWIDEMRQVRETPYTFREVFLSIFHPNSFPIPCDSPLSVLVILEGFQAILSEHGDANGSALGIPPISQIRDAALRLRRTYLTPITVMAETKELLLRWHTFCLDLATDTVILCQRLCMNFGMSQNLFAAGRRSPDPIDLNNWANTPEARRALLHAVAIQDLAELMTLGRAYPPHLPASVFAAATIFFAYSKYGQTTVTTPERPDWDAAWGQGTSQHHSTNDYGRKSPENSDSYRFVTGDYLNGAGTKTRNLRYSLLTLQMILQMISSQWGISSDMLAILSTWISGLT